jgi:hypothetical protein
MKLFNLSRSASLGLTALALALAYPGSVARAASDIIVGPSGSEAGRSGTDYEWQNLWGPAFVNITFDAANPPPTGDTQGSIYVQGNWAGSDADNYCIGSPGTSINSVTFDASQYASIEMDIKYDSTSTISPAANAHLNIGFDAFYSFQFVTNVSFDASSQAIADGHWHHLSIPVPSTISGAGSVHGVGFYQWNPGPTAGTMNFWVANIVVKARVVPVAPPTVKLPTKAVPGLNVFASTEGNSFYDRQEAELIQPSGLSWVGQATPANPVTYSFTIAGYPNSVNCEAWLFLTPNPAANDNAPDWNETNCIIFYVQGSPTNALGHFEYKVNEDHQQAMYSGGSETRTSGGNTYNYYYTAAPGSLPNGAITNLVSAGVYNITNENGNLATVTNNGLLGTWTLKFTSDTNGTLIAPNGNRSSFVIPPYNAANFAEQSSPGFNVYLGMQANQADGMNQAVVYANFAVSNTASPYSENFLTDTALDTTNIWNTAVAGGPKGVLIVPAGSAYWLTWGLPDSGFTLQTAPVLGNPLAWTTPSIGPLIPLFGFRSQLVAGSEVPAGNNAFFDLIKRTFTQLQILLPGETNAPNTITGKVGTPTAVNAGDPVNFTVNSVDATYHIVNSTDSITVSSTDGNASLPLPFNLVNGTAAETIYFNTSGSQTITATDTTSTNIPPAVSSSATVH